MGKQFYFSIAFREREREREKHQCKREAPTGCPLCAPGLRTVLARTRGQTCATQACTPTANQTCKLLVMGDTPTTEPHWPG